MNEIRYLYSILSSIDDRLSVALRMKYCDKNIRNIRNFCINLINQEQLRTFNRD